MKKLIIIVLLLTPLITTATEPAVLINEIAWMGTENSSNDEWLELYNSTDNEIDLTGWRLEAVDGSPKINLEGTIPAGGYFLLERTDDDSVPEITADLIYTGSLSNSGESLKLYDAENNIVDEIITTEGWTGGDNSTKQTLERSSLASWQTSLEPGGTPKAENSTGGSDEDENDEDENDDQQDDEDEQTQTDQSSTDEIAKAKKGDIVINEIFSNPKGIDLEGEFIELKNISKKIINITSWKIKNNAKQEFIITSYTLSPESIVLFYRPQTNLALNNNKEKITLYNTSNRIIDRVEYKSLAPVGESYRRDEEGKYFWGKISPRKDNNIKKEIFPIAIINGPTQGQVGQILTFDASDCFDPESRELNFSWNFGDGRTDIGMLVRQIYTQPDTYEVMLKVSANETASSTKKIKIKITGETKKKEKPDSKNQTATTGPTTTPEIIPLEEIPFIFISEFLPNPEGSDSEGEFIEIFSNHDKPVNLAGWQLDDAEGGSKPYTLPQTVIKPGQFLAFWRKETKIALNNSNEAVQLLAPDNTLVDYTDYEESKEGVSFVLDEQFTWQQSQTPSPGEINILDEIEEDEEDIEDKKEEEIKPKILGAAIKEDIENNEPKNRSKYIVSGISALVILGIGAGLKLKKKN